MICPKCQENGTPSKVYPGQMFSTAAYVQSYYDEIGKYHIHNNNVATEEYSCSNGHKMRLERARRCPSCDFSAGKDKMDVE